MGVTTCRRKMPDQGCIFYDGGNLAEVQRFVRCLGGAVAVFPTELWLYEHPDAAGARLRPGTWLVASTSSDWLQMFDEDSFNETYELVSGTTLDD